MIVIASGRKTNRTTRLIYLCHEAEARGEVSYMVVMNAKRAFEVAQKAKELDLQIGFPLTFNEFLDRRWYAPHIKNFFIDDVDRLLKGLAQPIAIPAVTILKEEE